MTSKELKITTRGKHSVMAMVKLTQYDNGDPVPLAQIARSSNISLSYLEQLFTGLRRKGLVRSFRGPGGGYKLGQAAKDIAVSEILICANETAPASHREENENNASGDQQTENLWHNIGNMLHNYLTQVTLDDVAKARLKDPQRINKLFENGQ